MIRFRWSSLYPKPWRREYGDEFDALLEMAPPEGADKLNIISHAIRCHFNASWSKLLALGAMFLIGYFNVVATEVQWAAGALMLSCLLASFFRPKKWIKNAIQFTLVIPISALWTYQLPGHHEPIYKCSIAIIPALIGSAIGMAAGMARRSISPMRNV